MPVKLCTVLFFLYDNVSHLVHEAFAGKPQAEAFKKLPCQEMKWHA